MRLLAHNDNARRVAVKPEADRLRRLAAALDNRLERQALPVGAVFTPKESLLPGWVHEAWAPTPADITSAMAFLMLAIQTDERPVLWITLRHLAHEHGLPYGPGLQAAGIDPSRLVLVRCRHEKEVQWALEEGLKSTALAAVIGEVNQMDLTASRRLTLAAREHTSRCLLLMRTRQAPASAAYSRWQIAPSNSEPDNFDPKAPGDARLLATLVKHRGGMRPETQMLEWPHATNSRALSPLMANRPTPPRLWAKQRITG